MKKIIALMLALVMCFAMVACDKGGDTASTNNFEVETTTDILMKALEAYDDDHMFAVMGGDYDNNVPDVPAKFNHENASYMESMLAVPPDVANIVDDAASMIHMMNANTFTAGAFHLKNVSDVVAFTDAFASSIVNRQWMCGFPEKYIVIADDAGYVVTAFGNGEMLDYFAAKVLTLGGEIIVDEPIEG